MRGYPKLAALALATAASPALAEDYASPDHRAVADAVTGFMDAIAAEDKTLLARHMAPEGLIFIHNNMDPDNPRVDTVPVSQHVERWATLTSDYEEVMSYDHVLVSGDMAQVWGPYSFSADGVITHCGVNSIGLVRDEEGVWKIGNTSFTMVDPTRCEEVGAGWVGKA